MKKLLTASLLGAMLLFAQTALAHSPICNCFDNGDGTVTCEGGFSDGSSASGVKMSILDPAGTVLMEGRMSKDSEYTFNRPSGGYQVVFDAGEGHSIKIDGSKIVE